MKSYYFKFKISIIKIICILLCLISVLSFAQQSKEEEREIDNQIKVANEYYQNFKTKELLKISNDILIKSEKLDYEKGLAYGNYFHAGVLLNVGNYKKSILYLHKAEAQTTYLKTNPKLVARINHLLGSNYNRLEIFSLASKKILKAIDILNKIEIKDSSLLNMQSANYTELSYLYSNMEKPDSVYYFLKKQRKELNLATSKEAFRQKALSEINLGNYFYYMLEKDDSARYYYTKALSRLESKDHFYKIGAILGLAGVDYEQNKLNDAIRNYSQALELVKKNKLSFGLRQAYEGLEMVYDKKGDYAKAKEYQALYQKLDDSVALATKLQRDSIINQVVQFEKQEQEQKSNAKFTRIALVVGVTILLFSIGAFFFIKGKRKELITEKENIIQEKEFENQDLKQKVNESFEEVVQLAKDNSPEFFTRFQEVYPDVVSKLKENSNSLRITELTLCAYFFLGFTPKDVALYTFKSIHTVRNRRQNLRNKLKVSADESFDLWFKNL